MGCNRIDRNMGRKGGVENMEGKGEFKWSIQGARKEGRKDRARGGIWIGSRGG